jgi:hypothetical protein
MTKIEALAKLITDWKDRTNQSIASIADATEVGYSTIRKLVSLDTDPSDDTVLKILCHVLDDDPIAIHSFACQYCPSLTRITELMVRVKFRSLDIPAVNSCVLREILKLCCTDAVIKRSVLEDKIGHNGSKIVDRLLDSKLISENDGEISAYKNLIHILKVSSHKKVAHFTIDNVEPSVSGNALYIGFHGFNRESATAIFNKISELDTYFHTLQADPKNAGEYNVVLSFAMTLI